MVAHFHSDELFLLSKLAFSDGDEGSIYLVNLGGSVHMLYKLMIKLRNHFNIVLTSA